MGKRSYPIITAIIFSFFVILTTGMVQATDRFVAPAPVGNDSGTCATSATPCATIGFALGQSAATGDVINVAAGSYTEAGISITAKNVGIKGAGANTTTIDGGGSHILTVDTDGTLDLSNVTLQNGKEGGSSTGGGCIRNLGTMTLRNSTVKTCDTGDGAGGGIGNAGTMTIVSSTISGNQAQTNGAGIANGGRQINGDQRSGTLVMVNSTISGNTSRIGGGGGLSNISCDPTNPPCETTATTSTAQLFNVTIAFNTGNDSSPSTEIPEGGGGVGIKDGSVTIKNTLIANNTDNSSNGAPDCFGTLTSGASFNLVENITGCTFAPGTGDVTGVDPNIGALAPNGGDTQTHALLSGSAAIDTGDPTGCKDNNGTTLTTDQRGSTRPTTGIVGNDPPKCDKGAFEAAAGTTGGGGGGGGGGCALAGPLTLSVFSTTWIMAVMGTFLLLRRSKH